MDGMQYTENNEGNRLVAYQDTRGYWTIGIGHCLGKGPGLEGTVWTQTQVDQTYDEDYAKAQAGAQSDIGAVCWAQLDPIRQSAIVDMSFELGKVGLGGFHKMISAILVQDWESAAADILASEYDWEVPARASNNASIILNGQWPGTVTS